MQERLLEGRTALVTSSIRVLASPSARRLPWLVLVSCIEKTSIALRQDFDASQQDFDASQLRGLARRSKDGL
jgi:hypothetical protein